MSSTLTACICEGACEEAIMDLLLENERLIFSRNQLLERKILRCRAAKTFQNRYLDKSISQPIRLYRILDSRSEVFKLSKVYEKKVEVINVITAPEIEMLIIYAENAYKDFKKSGKDPGDFAKSNLKIGYNKSYEFVKSYFSDIDKLLNAIIEHKRTAKIPKNEQCLADLLK